MENEYYLVKASALPEVLLKVAAAKELLRSGQVKTVQEVTDQLGISRSSFYKYKEDIESFAQSLHTREMTLVCVLQDQPGVLSDVLEALSDAGMNIETIYQSVPAGGLAELTVNAHRAADGMGTADMLGMIRKVKGVASVKLMARE